MPQGFYDVPELKKALARHDFGAVFRAVRKETGLTQEELGFLTGLSQPRVSAIESRQHRLKGLDCIARVCNGLGIPARLLGFSGIPGTVDDDGEVNWMHRRDFLVLITAATAGSSMHPDLHRLADLLPVPDDPSRSQPRIGHADVDAIENVTATLRATSFARGGGTCRTAAVAYLHQVSRLHDATCTGDVHMRLKLATADLAMLAAYTSFDDERHDAARRLWTYALDTATSVEDHPRGPDLAVNVLLDLTEQSLHLQRPDEALRLAKLASATSANSKFPVNSMTQSIASAYIGSSRAALGEVESCQRAFGQAQEEFARADPANCPHWTQWVSDTEIAAQRGHADFLLSKANPDFAADAAENLRLAVSEFANATGRTRARSLHMSSLTASYFQLGEIDAALEAGYETVDAMEKLSCKRTYARLRDIDTAAAAYAKNSDVAELRHRIETALQAA